MFWEFIKIFRCNCLIGFNTILKGITSTLVAYNVRRLPSYAHEAIFLYRSKILGTSIDLYMSWDCLVQTILTLVKHKVLHNLVHICNELFLVLSVRFLLSCNTCLKFFNYKITKAFANTNTRVNLQMIPMLNCQKDFTYW